MGETTRDWLKDSCLHPSKQPSIRPFSAFFGNRAVDPEMVRFVVGVCLAIFILLVCLLRPPVDLLLSKFSFSSELKVIKAKSSARLVEYLKEHNLWDVEPEAGVPPVIFSHFPDDLDNLDLLAKKRAFLHTLLPVAMVANAEVEQERAALLAVLDKLDGCELDLLMAEKRDEWQCSLTKGEIYFLQQLSDKYRTTKVNELLRRVNVVPVSLVLAQGALESSWGGSRFASEGNNLFGIWTWGKRGMIPLRRDEGKRHMVAMYDSLLDSVRSYLLMINRQTAYRELRAIREQSMDPLSLSNGLLRYSEKRDQYVADLQSFIIQNRLQRYDQCVLAANLPSRRGMKFFKLASLID